MRLCQVNKYPTLKWMKQWQTSVPNISHRWCFKSPYSSVINNGPRMLSLTLMCISICNIVYCNQGFFFSLCLYVRLYEGEWTSKVFVRDFKCLGGTLIFITFNFIIWWIFGDRLSLLRHQGSKRTLMFSSEAGGTQISVTERQVTFGSARGRGEQGNNIRLPPLASPLPGGIHHACPRSADGFLEPG